MFPRRKSDVRTYVDERQRLLIHAATLSPDSEQYAVVMARIDQLDKITKRSSEWLKALIPAAVTAASVASIYAVQQFAGVVVPKALDMLPSRTSKNREDD